MKSVFKVENPDTVEFTITITMPLRDWKQLKDQLGKGYPAYKLGEAIYYMIKQADTHFHKITDLGE